MVTIVLLVGHPKCKRRLGLPDWVALLFGLVLPKQMIITLQVTDAVGRIPFDALRCFDHGKKTDGDGAWHGQLASPARLYAGGMPRG
jgi:hypothetical protein